MREWVFSISFTAEHFCLRFKNKISYLKFIGIGEIYCCKGYKYVTVFYDLDRACVVWVGQGKGRGAIDEFFAQKISDYQRNQIKRVCCDINQTYIGAIEEHCPNATLILDRFYIAKALGYMQDESVCFFEFFLYILSLF